MPSRSVWLRAHGLVGAVMEGMVEEAHGSRVAKERPARHQRHRCGICGRRCRLYDQGDGRRRWRGLDLGYTRFFLEAAAPRVRCREHGVVVARVPWARQGSGFIRAFEDQVAWLATQRHQLVLPGLPHLDRLNPRHGPDGQYRRRCCRGGPVDGIESLGAPGP